MANRHTLHSNKLDAFRKWLIKTGWTIEEPKGIWEVLRAKKAGRQNPLIVYQKTNKEHLSVLDRDIDIIKDFLRDNKKKQTNADRIRSMTDEELAIVLKKVLFCGGLIVTNQSSTECRGCKDGYCCNIDDWLKAESEE